MAQTTKLQFSRVVALIICVGLILLVGGFGYYYFFGRDRKPTQVYSVTVNPNKAVKLIPRPRLRRDRHGPPSLNFYFRGEAIDVSQYWRVKVLNPKKINLRLLEVLDDRGLVIAREQWEKGGERTQHIRYKELAVLEEMPSTQDVPGYFIEVDKLERGRRYVLCKWMPQRSHPRRYFFAFIRQ